MSWCWGVDERRGRRSRGVQSESRDTPAADGYRKGLAERLGRRGR